MPKKISHYSSYTLEQYLEDAEFRAFILNSSDKDRDAWEAIWRELPEQASIAAKAKELLIAMEQQFYPDFLKKQDINEAFIEDMKQQMLHQQRRLSRQNYIQRWAVVASVFIFISLGSWLLMTNVFNQMRHISTDYGEWQTLSLPDGSKVNLNANSSIRFARNWKRGESREIWLEGEAFFNVNKDAEGSTFTVHTDDLGVEVLGTAFNVNTRGKETEVFLQEGSVRLDLGEEEKLMEPGDLITYSAPQKKIINYKKLETDAYASWKDGSMILKDELVSDILQKIEELYGYTFIVEDEELLLEKKTIAIPLDKIEITIPILERILGVEITQKDKQLIVK